jgi:small subunit ribosomal protein S6
VRMDEEDKRVAKIKAHRDAHVKRSTLPHVNAEAATTEAPAAAEPEVAEPEPAIAS